MSTSYLIQEDTGYYQWTYVITGPLYGSDRFPLGKMAPSELNDFNPIQVYQQGEVLQRAVNNLVDALGLERHQYSILKIKRQIKDFDAVVKVRLVADLTDEQKVLVCIHDSGAYMLDDNNG